MNNKTNEKQINFYCIQELVGLNKMFEENLGMSVSAFFVKKAGEDIKFVKGELDLHTYDLFDQEKKVIVSLRSEDEEKYMQKWYILEGYQFLKFDHWKITAERTEYKNK